MCLCFVFREIDDQSSRSTSTSTDSSRNTSGTSNDSTDIDQREGANYIGSAKENIHRVVRLGVRESTSRGRG